MKASIKTKQTIVTAMDASKLQWAVVFHTGSSPQEKAQGNPVDSEYDHVHAVFQEKADAEEFRDKKLPNAGMVVQIEPDNGLKPGVYSDRGALVDPIHRTIPLVQRGLLFHSDAPDGLARATMGPISLGRSGQVFLAQAEVTWLTMTIPQPSDKVVLGASGSTPAEAQNKLLEEVFAQMEVRSWEW